MELLFRGSGRTQRIPVQGALSNVFPQGSCSGPLWFNIYSSKVFVSVGRHLPKVHCYADDSQLYLSFNTTRAFSHDEAIRSMESCISKVKKRVTSNNLMLNDDKTEFIVLASRLLLKKAAVKARANARNIVGQQDATLLEPTCYERLHTMLCIVACCCDLLEVVG